MMDQNNIQVQIKTSIGDVVIPEAGGFNLKSGENVIFPFNFNLNGAKLNYATAQLLMKGDDANPYYVFFALDGTKGEFSFASGIDVKNIQGTIIDKNNQRTLVNCNGGVAEFSVIANGKKTTVLVIDKTLALKSYIVSLNGKKSLIFSDAVVLQNENGFELLSNDKNSFEIDVYPKITIAPKASLGTVAKIERNAAFSSWRITLPPFQFEAKTKEVSTRKITAALPPTIPSGVNDIYLTVNYTADTGMDFINGELVADNLYNGLPWQIGLRKFLSSTAKPREMVFYFRPMQKNATYLLDLQPYPQFIPDFGRADSYLKINSVFFTPQYKTTIKF
jgi:hypothetical protein